MKCESCQAELTRDDIKFIALNLCFNCGNSKYPGWHFNTFETGFTIPKVFTKLKRDHSNEEPFNYFIDKTLISFNCKMHESNIKDDIFGRARYDLLNNEVILFLIEDYLYSLEPKRNKSPIFNSIEKKNSLEQSSSIIQLVLTACEISERLSKEYHAEKRRDISKFKQEFLPNVVLQQDLSKSYQNVTMSVSLQGENGDEPFDGEFEYSGGSLYSQCKDFMDEKSFNYLKQELLASGNSAPAHFSGVENLNSKAELKAKANDIRKKIKAGEDISPGVVTSEEMFFALRDLLCEYILDPLKYNKAAYKQLGESLILLVTPKIDTLKLKEHFYSKTNLEAIQKHLIENKDKLNFSKVYLNDGKNIHKILE